MENPESNTGYPSVFLPMTQIIFNLNVKEQTNHSIFIITLEFHFEEIA